MMTSDANNREQLLREIDILKTKIAMLEKSEIEHKQIEKALLNNKKNFRDLIENLLDGVAITDENAKHIYVNPKFSKITGYSRDELFKMTGWDFTRSEDIAKLKKRMKDRIAGKPIQTNYERIIVKKDGTEIPVEMSTTVTIWKGKKRPMAIIHDITERKKAEKEIRQKTEDLALINLLHTNFNRGDSLQEILHIFVKETSKLFSCDGATIYLLSEDKEYMLMQNLVLKPSVKKKIERIIGIKIPMIKLLLKKGSMYFKTLQTGKSQLINDPSDIQSLATEFTKTVSLPGILYKTIQKYVPRILKILSINSVIIIPLISEEENIGLLYISSEKTFTKAYLHRLETISIQLTAIIKRKRIEEDLKKNEQFFYSVLGSVQDGVSVLSPDLTVLHVNATMKKWYGENLPLEEKKCYKVYHNADKPCKPCPTLRCLESGKTEWNIVSGLPGSPVKWIELFSYPIIDPNSDKITGVVEFVRDITERKQAEEKLKEKSQESKKQLEKSEKQRIASLVVLNDLNKTTKELHTEINERKQVEKIQNTLFNISNTLNRIDNIEELYSKIRKFLGDIIDTTNFFIALYDEKTDMISLPFHVDEKDEFETFPAGKTMVKYVIKTGKPLFATDDVVEDLTKKGIVETIGAHSEIWLGVPLKIGKKIIGVIAVQSYDDPRLYTEKDLEILTFVSEEIALAIQHKQADEQMKKDLEIKNTMLAEIHHRVKNNLQIISSLLKLQSAHITDKRALELFQNSRDRVKTMALIHDALYRSKDLANIDFAYYVRKLVTQIFISYNINSNLIELKLDIQDVLVDINTAIPCGLIINELVSNSLKYAFPEGRKGEINISFTQKNLVNTLCVKDHGIGISKKIDLENSTTLGLTLVSSLTKQLNGTLKLEKVKGTSFKITFKKIELKTYGKV